MNKQVEEMNKQIEEMAKCCPFLKDGKCQGDSPIDTDCDLMCKMYGFITSLIQSDYRKQSEGEWILEHETYGKMRCSVCGKECPTERKPDPYEDYQMTDFYITGPFCPNCGAKMKGGE